MSHTPIGECTSDCRRDGCPEPAVENSLAYAITDKQYAWIYHHIMPRVGDHITPNQQTVSLRVAMNRITASSIIGMWKNGQKEEVENKLKHLNVI